MHTERGRGGRGGGSRPCRCPICGVHIALLMAQEHAAACAEGTLVRGAVPADDGSGRSSGGSGGRTQTGAWGSLKVFYTQTHTHTHTYTHTFTHTFAHTFTHTRTHVCMHTYMHACAHVSKAPSAKDISGPRRTRKALDHPPQPFDFLVVLDYEWTCDNQRRLEPSEIIEFPSVLVKCAFPPHVVDEFQVSLSLSLSFSLSLAFPCSLSDSLSLSLSLSLSRARARALSLSRARRG